MSWWHRFSLAKLYTQWSEYLEVWELCDSGPEILGGGSEHPEDPEQLIYLRVSLEQRPSVDHLSEDGADAPDVKWTGVLGAAKENLT